MTPVPGRDCIRTGCSALRRAQAPIPPSTLEKYCTAAIAAGGVTGLRGRQRELCRPSASGSGLAGFGRTDARPYFNLNFDPNDALTFGAGHQSADGLSYVLFVVADDRFHTGQRDWHFNIRIPAGDSHATLDLLRKSGLSDAGPITAWGFSANWDWPAWFLRVAYDPYQNFSAQNAWRFAGGVRS